MGYTLGLLLTLLGAWLTAIPQEQYEAPSNTNMGVLLIIIGVILMFLNYLERVAVTKEFVAKELEKNEEPMWVETQRERSEPLGK